MAKEINLKKVFFQSKTPVLVDFWAPWCGPCLAISAEIDELAEKYKGKAFIVKVNVEKHPEIAKEFNIRSIPTLVFFKSGKEIYRHIGYAKKSILESKLENVFEEDFF
ncbi:MAG TPA: thioredoxin [Blattabacteriaceae bacterium]